MTDLKEYFQQYKSELEEKRREIHHAMEAYSYQVKNHCNRISAINVILNKLDELIESEPHERFREI